MGKHHNTLGIAITATPDEIKKAYRKLCMIHHPDKGGNADTFLRVQEAYDSLTTIPVIAKAPVYRQHKPIKFNSYVNCYANYITSKGNVELHFTLQDMFNCRIIYGGRERYNWYLTFKSDYTIVIPKKFLIECNYTFTLDFTGMGSSEVTKYNFSWPDPRSKWQKFWDKIF